VEWFEDFNDIMHTAHWKEKNANEKERKHSKTKQNAPVM
jgi:hypothetical protein